MEKQCSIYALVESLHSILDDERQELLDDTIYALFGEDRLHEIVDGTVPVYYGELAECLQSDHTLAYVDDEGLIDVTADDFSVWKLIQVAIYERLMQEAQEWLDEQRKGGE